MQRKINILLILIFLFIIYVYTLVIDGISSNYVIFEGETLPIRTILGLSIQQNNETVETIANTGQKKVDNIRYEYFKFKPVRQFFSKRN